MEPHFQADIDAVRSIPAIPTILNVICEATGMGFAAVARVTENRWIACEVLDNVHFGLPAGGELKVETTLCHEVRGNGREIVIDNVAEDPNYANHHTPRIYNLQSYISVPITLPDGTFFGTLCAIDTKPARLKNSKTIGMFRLFAELIAYHLSADDKIAASRNALDEERATALLREQFIAVLGHDLRNPLASVEAGTNILVRTPLDERAQMVVAMMRKSVTRMSRLVDNILDFARGRSSGGIVLETSEDQEIRSVIQQVVDEFRSTHAERDIFADIGVLGRLSYDRIRIQQLVSNLVGNAIAHGAEHSPIRLTAHIEGDVFDLSVSNAGEAIPPEVLDHLFEPFFRARAGANQQGLGLGLFIANEIAKAHGGTLTVSSTDKETSFSFRMTV